MLIFVDEDEHEHVLVTGPECDWRLIETAGDLLQQTEHLRDGTNRMTNRIARGKALGRHMQEHASKAGTEPEDLTPDDQRRFDDKKRASLESQRVENWDF